MSERFFLETPPADDRATLTGDEARHLTRVMRAAVGDSLELFDGRGGAWQAEVMRLGRQEVELVILAESPAAEPHTPTATTLTIAAALPKGDRQKWMVEKLTELGAARLVPLSTARSVAEATPSALTRLRRQVIEACKQCRRNTLLEIAEPQSLAEACDSRGPGTLGLLTDPAGQPAGRLLTPPPTSILALIGPEGGFTPNERQLALDSGFTAIRLGPHILRVETAAIALAAAVSAVSISSAAGGA